jgi:pSer/pThr/pTyr-binding forkhead associated (FHA) protein
MYPLTTETRIGRDPNADVFIGYFLVARWQCILVWDEDMCCHFIDRGWFRPVFVNDRRVGEQERVPLQIGDRITIADITLVYDYVDNGSERRRRSAGDETHGT